MGGASQGGAGPACSPIWLPPLVGPGRWLALSGLLLARARTRPYWAVLWLELGLLCLGAEAKFLLPAGPWGGESLAQAPDGGAL